MIFTDPTTRAFAFVELVQSGLIDTDPKLHIVAVAFSVKPEVLKDRPGELAVQAGELVRYARNGFKDEFRPQWYAVDGDE